MLEHAQTPRARAYGNAVNGFVRNSPLSDEGFDPRARFSNVLLDGANVFGKFRFDGGCELSTRVGRQVLSWGEAQFVAGGINVVNPVDAPALVRPGAVPGEGRIPVGMLHGRLGLGAATHVEGFVQYEFRPAVLNGCGTFYATANYAPTGCYFVNVLGGAGVNDPTAVSTGRYPKRVADQNASTVASSVCRCASALPRSTPICEAT